LACNPETFVKTCWLPATTKYVLSAWNILGYRKPSKDTVVITVLPKMLISMGADTAVVIGQPLQLNETGSEFYDWFPPLYLSAPDIHDPVALFQNPSNGIRFKVIGSDGNGCADSAFIVVKVFRTMPSIYVPTAFTLNNDGKNDVLSPIAVGMKSINAFAIYNRWGQLVFTTTANGKGWDGLINGQVQTTGTYIWMVKSTDYPGNSYFQKGIFTLIR
jgi:gliding motility-associated-like protein